MTMNRVVYAITLMTLTLMMTLLTGCFEPDSPQNNTDNGANNGATTSNTSNTTGDTSNGTTGDTSNGTTGGTSNGTSNGNLPDANQDLCERTPMDWLRNPENRFPNENVICDAGPTGICFGMNLAELYMAYQVTFDPSRPAVSTPADIPVHEVLSNVMMMGFENGRPVTIPGAANPAEAAQVYGSEWIATMRDFQMRAHALVYGGLGDQWLDDIGYEGSDEPSSCEEDALRLRLNSGRPALMMAELSDSNYHSIIPISYIEPTDGPHEAIIEIIDPNHPGEIARLGCDRALTSCTHSHGDFTDKPLTENFDGQNHNLFVDALDHLYQQQCPQRPVVRDSVYTLISRADGEQATSTVFNRFVLDEGGIVRQLARQRVHDAQGTELLWIWEASSDTTIVYTFAPAPAPVTRSVVAQVGGETEVLPLTPGISRHLLDCLGDSDLEGCLTSPEDARFTSLARSDERCNPCLMVARNAGPNQPSHSDYCLPTETGYRETLLPLRISASGGGGTADNIFSNLRVRRHDDAMFAEPTGCVPLPGVDNVSICN